jgi:hypothetical protein
VVGQFQKANFGEGVGYLGQQPDEPGALFDKLIHATTPESEKRTPTPELRRVNGAQQLGCGRVAAAESISAASCYAGNLCILGGDSGYCTKQAIENGRLA